MGVAMTMTKSEQIAHETLNRELSNRLRLQEFDVQIVLAIMRSAGFKFVPNADAQALLVLSSLSLTEPAIGYTFPEIYLSDEDEHKVIVAEQERRIERLR